MNKLEENQNVDFWTKIKKIIIKCCKFLLRILKPQNNKSESTNKDAE